MKPQRRPFADGQVIKLGSYAYADFMSCVKCRQISMSKVLQRLDTDIYYLGLVHRLCAFLSVILLPNDVVLLLTRQKPLFLLLCSLFSDDSVQTFFFI